MSFLSGIFGKREQPQPQQQFVLKYTGNSLIMLPPTQDNLYRQGYLANSTVYSLVTKIAAKVATIPIYPYMVKNSKSLKEYRALTGSYDPKALLEARKLLKMDFEEIQNPLDPVNRLMKQPNSGMDYAAFTEFVLMNEMITGGCPVYALPMANAGGVSSLYPFNSKFLRIQPDNTLMNIKFAQLIVNIGGLTMTPENLYFVRYTDPDIKQDGSHLFGHSPLASGLLEVQKDNENTKVQLFQFQNKGVTGFFRPENVDAANMIQSSVQGPDKARQSLDDLMNRANSGSMRPFTPLPVVYNSFGMDAVQMELIESAIASKEKIAELYDYPKPLLSNDAASYNNVNSAVKYLITNTAAPHMKRLEGMWNWAFKKMGRPDVVALFDISSQPEIQQDIQMLADWMSKAGVYSINEIREVTKYSRLELPNCDEPLVNAGMMPISQLGEDMGSDEFEGLNT
jgi:phage portal protein BeeE